MKKDRSRWSTLLLVASSTAVLAQAGENFAPPATPPQLRAVRATGAITVDGVLAEADWANAPAVGDFFRTEPRQGGPVRYATEVRVLFDERAVYFGAWCADSAGRDGIRVQNLRRDFPYGDNDALFIQLDPQRTRRYCVSVQATPYGNQRDAQVFDDAYVDNDWDALWTVRTTRTDSGYFAEFEIPFKMLRYDVPAAGEDARWGITIARLARRDYEQSVWPPVPQAFSPYRMTYAADLVGLEVPDPALNLRVQPYALAEVTEGRQADGSSEAETRVRVGGEAKWAITPQTVADLTVNTDFAQADVDLAVNNLTRFNLFFPERRQFFLENSGIFAGADGAIRPYFSRTIGLANTQFDADPIPIDVGARLTHRDDEQTVAGLYVRQRGRDGVQPAADFGVLRYLRNYGAQNNVGVMGTYRHDADSGELGLAAGHNATVTVDGLYRPSDSWTLTYLLTGSRDLGAGATPGDAGEPVYGVAGDFFAGYTGPKAYLGWVTRGVSRDYRADMGFVFGQDVIRHNPGGYAIVRPKKGWAGEHIRRYDPGAFLDVYQEAGSLDLQEVTLDAFPLYVIFQSNALLTGSVLPTYQRFDAGFPILGRQVDPGEYRYTRYRLSYRSDQSRPFAYSVLGEAGGYYAGRLQTADLGLRIAPSPRAALELNAQLNRFEGFGAEREDFAAQVYTATLRLAASPRLQLNTVAQYNTVSDLVRVNARLSWEFQPLSFLYVIVNESDFRESPRRERGALLKVNWTRQF